MTVRKAHCHINMSLCNYCVLVLASFCVVAFAATTKDLCPNSDGDLKVFDKNCFYFHVNENATLEEAESACRGIDGHLVMVKSPDISGFIQNELTNTYNLSKHIWIGLTRFHDPNDQKEPELYQWVDDKHTDKIDTNLLESIKKYGDIIQRVTGADESVENGDEGKPYVCQYEVKDGSTPRPTPITGITAIGKITTPKLEVNSSLMSSNKNSIVSESMQASSGKNAIPVVPTSPTGPIIVTKTVVVTQTKTVRTTIVTHKTVTVTKGQQATSDILTTSTVPVYSSSSLSPSSSGMKSLSATATHQHPGVLNQSIFGTATSQDETPSTIGLSDTPAVKSSDKSTGEPMSMSEIDELQSVSPSPFVASLSPNKTDILNSSKIHNVQPNLSSTPPMTATATSLYSSSSSVTANEVTPSIIQITPHSIISSSWMETSAGVMLATRVLESDATNTSKGEETTSQPSTLRASISSQSPLQISPTTSSKFDSAIVSISSPLSTHEESVSMTEDVSSLQSGFTTMSTGVDTANAMSITPSLTAVESLLTSTIAPSATQSLSRPTLSQALSTPQPSLYTTQGPSTVSKPSTMQHSSWQHSSRMPVTTAPLIPTSPSPVTTTPLIPTSPSPVTTTPLIPTSPSPVTTRGPCPSIDNKPGSMQQFKDKCFYFQIDKRVRFANAKGFCQKHGGWLASIKNDDSQSFILQKLQDLLAVGEVGLSWIGIENNSTGDGKYYWQDGDLVVYNNFRDGAPHRNLVAILSDSGSWMPLSPMFHCNFICEFDAFISKPTVTIHTTPSSPLISEEENSPIDFMSESEIPEDEFSTEIIPYPSSDIMIDELFSPDAELVPSSADDLFTNDMTTYEEETVTLPDVSPSLESFPSETLWDGMSTDISPSSSFNTETTMSPNTTTASPSTPRTTRIPLPFQNECYQFGDKCFYFNLKDRVSFLKASKFCMQFGGSLAFIKDNNTQSFVVRTLHDKLNVKHTKLMWIGLQLNSTKTKNDELYYWMDGQLATYKNFLDQSPYKDKVVLLSSSGRWVDMNPAFLFYFICQFDSPIPITTSTTTTTTTTENTTTTATIKTNTTTTPILANSTNTTNATMTPTNSTATTNTTSMSVTPTATTNTTSMSVTPTATTNTTLMSATPTATNATNTAWTPTNSTSNTTTTSMPTISTTTTTTTPIPTTPTPIPYKKPCYQFGDKCFYFQLVQRLSFQNALSFCQQYGGSLAQIKNLETQLFIEKVLHEKMLVQNFHLLWIGLSRKTDGQYYWLDGEKASYNNFQNRRPQRQSIVLLSTNGRWLSLQSNSGSNFICEFESKISTEPATAIAPTTALSAKPKVYRSTKNQCPFQDKDRGQIPDSEEFVQVFNEYKCLYFKINARATFQDAKEECQKHGASLVMIKSKELQNYIELQFNRTVKPNYHYRFWIGLHLDPAHNDGKYYWLDGTPLDYDHFKFAPSPDAGNHAVLVLKGGEWFETAAHHRKNAFICEYNLPR